MAALDYGALIPAAGLFPRDSVGHGNAPPGHPLFGVAFLFIGSLLVVETLAGQVWFRSRLRTMLWPATVILAGLGMLVVSYVQPSQKTLHLSLALLLLAGGYFEARYRLGQIPKTTADLVVIPALILAGLVSGPMHISGPMSSLAAQAHLLVGLMGFALAGIRLTQVRFGSSVALDAGFGMGVMLLGLSLLMVQQFHAAH